jgi:hypothetical protein
MDQSDGNTAITNRSDNVASSGHVFEAEAKADSVSAAARLMIEIESGRNLTIEAQHTPIFADSRFDQTGFDIRREIELLREAFGLCGVELKNRLHHGGRRSIDPW